MTTETFINKLNSLFKSGNIFVKHFLLCNSTIDLFLVSKKIDKL